MGEGVERADKSVEVGAEEGRIKWDSDQPG